MRPLTAAFPKAESAPALRFLPASDAAYESTRIQCRFRIELTLDHLHDRHAIAGFAPAIDRGRNRWRFLDGERSVNLRFQLCSECVQCLPNPDRISRQQDRSQASCLHDGVEPNVCCGSDLAQEVVRFGDL